MTKTFNKKVVIQSIFALIFFVLGFLISYWLFLPTAYFIWSNQRELMNKK
ncbi:MAG: hypothetical protein AABY00_02820 [Nanoarchaeota archaeon]